MIAVGASLCLQMFAINRLLQLGSGLRLGSTTPAVPACADAPGKRAASCQTNDNNCHLVRCRRATQQPRALTAWRLSLTRANTTALRQRLRAALTAPLPALRLRVSLPANAHVQHHREHPAYRVMPRRHTASHCWRFSQQAVGWRRCTCVAISAAC